MTRLYILPIVSGARRFSFYDGEDVGKFDRGGIAAAKMELETLLARYDGEELSVFAALIPKVTDTGIALLRRLAPNVNLIPLGISQLRNWHTHISDMAEAAGFENFHSGAFDAYWTIKAPAACLHAIDPTYSGYSVGA